MIAKKLNVSSKQANNIYNELVLFKHSMSDLSSNQQSAYKVFKSKGMSEEKYLKYTNALKLAKGMKAFKVLSKRVQKQLCDQQSLREGTQALLRNEIIKEYDKYMGREWIPIYAMENMNAMYKAYRALGGNGTITKLMEEIRELPSREPSK